MAAELMHYQPTVTQVLYIFPPEWQAFGIFSLPVFFFGFQRLRPSIRVRVRQPTEALGRLYYFPYESKRNEKKEQKQEK